MINLLPVESKKQIRAARNNHVIRRYYSLLLITAALLVIVFGIGFKVTFDQEASYISIKGQNEKEVAKFESVRKAAQNFSSDLDVAKTILASDVRLTTTITSIASVIPSGVILSNLSLNTQDTTNAPLTINARAKTYDQALELKNNLEASPIFENVSLVSVTTGISTSSVDDGTVAAYPVAVTISAKLTKTAGGSK
jgi:Tfp pilus assembly protein PilN